MKTEHGNAEPKDSPRRPKLATRVRRDSPVRVRGGTRKLTSGWCQTPGEALRFFLLHLRGAWPEARVKNHGIPASVKAADWLLQRRTTATFLAVYEDSAAEHEWTEWGRDRARPDSMLCIAVEDGDVIVTHGDELRDGLKDVFQSVGNSLRDPLMHSIQPPLTEAA